MNAFSKSPVALLWIVLFNLTPAVIAQETTRLEKERIRVTWTPATTVLREGVQIRPISAVGSFVSLTTDSLTFRAEQGNQFTAVAVSEISRLEISRRGSKARQGLFVGLISGATVGLLAGASCSGDNFFNCSGGEVVGITLVMAGIGGGIGALVGSAMSGEHWETIPVPDVARGS
jgi:hypothetical protein